MVFFLACVAFATPFNIVTIIAYFNGYLFTLKKGYTPETSVLIDNVDTFCDDFFFNYHRDIL